MALWNLSLNKDGWANYVGDVMTPEAQRIAIAEACGWLEQGDGFWRRPDGQTVHHCPDYLNDLNAMHEAVMFLTQKRRTHFNAELMDDLNPHLAYSLDRTINATAPQRAKAFLRAIGKWAEDPVTA